MFADRDKKAQVANQKAGDVKDQKGSLAATAVKKTQPVTSNPDLPINAFYKFMLEFCLLIKTFPASPSTDVFTTEKLPHQFAVNRSFLSRIARLKSYIDTPSTPAEDLETMQKYLKFCLKDFVEAFIPYYKALGNDQQQILKDFLATKQIDMQNMGNDVIQAQLENHLTKVEAAFTVETLPTLVVR